MVLMVTLEPGLYRVGSDGVVKLLAEPLPPPPAPVEPPADEEVPDEPDIEEGA